MTKFETAHQKTKARAEWALEQQQAAEVALDEALAACIDGDEDGIAAGVEAQARVQFFGTLHEHAARLRDAARIAVAEDALKKAVAKATKAKCAVQEIKARAVALKERAGVLANDRATRHTPEHKKVLADLAEAQEEAKEAQDAARAASAKAALARAEVDALKGVDPDELPDTYGPSERAALIREARARLEAEGANLPDLDADADNSEGFIRSKWQR